MTHTAIKFILWGTLVVVAVLTVNDAHAQDPSDFLRRLDTNGNNMIDPSEVEGRMGYFIKRMAENNPKIDLSRPVSINQLTEEFKRMREQGGMGGGPSGRGGPPSRGDSGRGDSGRGGGDSNRGGRGGSSEQSSPYRSNTPTSVEPLVPGFGIEDVFTPPPGFGAEAELFTVEITDDDRREAQRAFGYYDANRNGKIDSSEMKRSRYGSDLPMYDKNRDGVITMNEMEYRYARRRVENTQDSGGNSSKKQGRSRGSNDDSRDEDRYRFGDQLSYRVTGAIERLPAGLPDWFARNDADADGQVSMAEFSASWSDSVFEEYNNFDLNQDGLITPQECLTAAERGVDRGDSVGGGSSSSSDSSTESSSAGSAQGIDPRYLSYYKKLFEKYDSDKNGKLNSDEWSKMSKNPEAADTNGDKAITVEEYAIWSMKR